MKPFPNLIKPKKDRNLSSYKSRLKQEEKIKSKPLIISGFIISLTSIFLLLFTINNKFGWFMSNLNYYLVTNMFYY